MEPQILEFEPKHRKQRILSALVQAAIWTFLMFIWQYLTHRSKSNSSSLLSLAFSTIVGGMIFGSLIYILPFGNLTRGIRKHPARFGIRVESDQIALLYKDSEGAAWLPRMIIHKGKVRSIFRIPGGIGVSERNQLSARMLGFVVIPYSLPRFEELSALLESWKSA